MDKEAIARIIDPKGWEYHDDHLRRAEKWEAEGKPADHALVGGYRNGAAYNVAESLAKATAILALQSSERGEPAKTLEQIATDMDRAIAGGMAWIDHSEANEFCRRIRAVAAILARNALQGDGL